MRERLDKLLLARNLATTRQQAQRLIMAGQVLVAEQPVTKAGSLVEVTAAIRVRGEDLPWVSRGGIKLEHALDGWNLDPAGWCCLDVGASTGGFTDLLLTRGATRVYCVDVGYGQLAWKLVTDPRVVNLERTNIRYLAPGVIPELVDFLVMDVSFISLRIALPAALPWVRPGGGGVVLIKPQFEVGRGLVGKGGVVRDPELVERTVAEMVEFAVQLGLREVASLPSPITGPKGNREYLMRFTTPAGGG